MILATRDPVSSAGGSASLTVYISAQNPPWSGAGGVAHSRSQMPVVRRSACGACRSWCGSRDGLAIGEVSGEQVQLVVGGVDGVDGVMVDVVEAGGGEHAGELGGAGDAVDVGVHPRW